MAPAGQSSSQPLPQKELGVFRKIVKCYESKQFKIGLKLTKNILGNAQFAEHGETLAMKGLILNCMGRGDEAMDLVKRGLKADIRSYVCWHVFGLVNRHHKNYDEAVKAYKMALRLDPSNMQILRDICLLQIQLRDYEGYRDSRFQLLKLRPTQRMTWIGYVTAYHLLKQYDKALAIVGEFITNNQPTTTYDFEHSELLMYQNMILRESGQPKLALEKLEENSALICDKLSYMETRAELLIDLDRLDDAASVYEQLIKRNPENIGYYVKLEQCKRLGDGAPIADRLAMYDDLAKKYPRASAPVRQTLYFAEGDELRTRLMSYIINGLRKGAPSLFKNLVPMYTSPSKVQLIEGILVDFVKRLEDNGYKNGSLEGDAESCESPTTTLWLYYLMAQHYDKVGNLTVAMKYADRAIQHTPTLIELFMMKAKIHKHTGDLREAARVMDDVQAMDTADRYINSKCAKYMLRAGMVTEAEAMCAKFTREGVSATINLNEMQCMWYELEVARSYRLQNQYGEALKKCHQMDQHFTGMVEDQFDFHTYCLRKMTLCSYIALLRLEDTIRSHEWYYHAAKCAAKIYLRMLDRPQDMLPPEPTPEINANLTEEERKKLKREQAKEKAKKEAEAERQKEREKKRGKEGKKKEDDGLEGPVGLQLDPQALLKTENPLNDAAKFVEPLVRLGCRHVTGYYLGFEVYFRKNKPLLMLQCLNAARKIDARHPLLHICNVKFLNYLASFKDEGVVGELVEELTTELFGKERDAKAVNEQYKQENIGSLPSRMAVAECNLVLDPKSAANTKSWLLKSIEDNTLSGRTLKMLVKLRDGISYGRYGTWSKDEVDGFTKVCRNLYKDAAAFGAVSSKDTNGAAEPSNNTPTHTFDQ